MEEFVKEDLNCESGTTQEEVEQKLVFEIGNQEGDSSPEETGSECGSEEIMEENNTIPENQKSIEADGGSRFFIQRNRSSPERESITLERATSTISKEIMEENNTISNGQKSIETDGGRGSFLQRNRSSPVLRESITPERAISPRLSIMNLPDINFGRIRHSSGNKSKLDNIPDLERPLTYEGFKSFCEYLQENNFNSADVLKVMPHIGLGADEVITGRENADTTALHIAAENNYPTVLEALLQSGHSVLNQTEKGYTALHLAIFWGHGEIVKQLVARSGDGLLNVQDNMGNAPVHIAMMSQNREALKMLRYKGADFTKKNKLNQTPLHLATNMYKMAIENNGSAQEVRYLELIVKLESLLNFLLDNLKPEEIIACMELDTHGESPLHSFASIDYFYGIKIICDKVENSDRFDVKNADSGLTPFSMCIAKTFLGSETQEVNMDNILMMINDEVRDRNENKKRNLSKMSIHVQNSPLESAKLLLKKMSKKTINNINPRIKNMTALQIILKNVEIHFKSTETERDIVEMLLKKDADVYSSHAGSGEAPIHIVNSQNFDKSITFLFIEHLTKDTVNQQDEMGETVLHYAVGLIDEDRISMLLEKGANVMIKNKDFDMDFDMMEGMTFPHMKSRGQLHRRTPLLVALTQSMLASGTYFKSLKKVGVERVISNINNQDLMEFFQTHVAAASFLKDNQVLRELCKILTTPKLLKKLLRLQNENLTDNEIIYKVIHYSDQSHFEKTFNKTALAWTNENDDTISASELLHLEYKSHRSKKEGLSCMKLQLTNDKLLFWITRTFSKFYQSPAYIRWTTAVLMSCLQLGLSYFYYIFDILSDYQLTQDYQMAYEDVDNYKQKMLDCARNTYDLQHDTPQFEASLALNFTYDNSTSWTVSEELSCFQLADRYPQRTYHVAFALTWFSMIVSVLVYLVGIVFFFDTDNLTSKFDWFNRKTRGNKSIKKCVKTIGKFFIICVTRILWPFFHMYRRIRYEASRNKSNRRKNLIEFEGIWMMVKSIEYGIEATIQMIIVLYLLVPYYDEIHNWDFQTTVKKIIFGIAHFLTGGRYNQACLLEKVIGKLAMNVFGQTFSLTNLKYLKYGMSMSEHLTSMIPLFLSYLGQIVARILVLRVFFVTAEEYLPFEGSKALAITLFFLLHFLLTLFIKIIYEVKMEDNQNLTWFCFRGWVKFLINWLSSSTIYIWANTGYNALPKKHADEHNTFLPQLFFQCLILVEHLILVLIPLSLDSTDCLDQHTFILTAKLVPCLWVISNLCLMFHYKNSHTWSQTNGPTQTCLSPRELENTSSNQGRNSLSCVTSFCCVPGLHRLTLGGTKFLRVRNIAENIEDFELVPRDNGDIEIKTNIINSEPLLR